MHAHRHKTIIPTGVPVKDLLELWWVRNKKQRRQEFVPVKQAAARAGVSPRTIRDWIQQGSLSCLVVGNRHYVYLPTLKKYLQACSDTCACAAESNSASRPGSRPEPRTGTGGQKT